MMKKIVFNKEKFEKVLNGEKVFFNRKPILLNKNIFRGNLIELAHGKEITMEAENYMAILENIGDRAIVEMMIDQPDKILKVAYVTIHPRKKYIKDLFLEISLNRFAGDDLEIKDKVDKVLKIIREDNDCETKNDIISELKNARKNHNEKRELEHKDSLSRLFDEYKSPSKKYYEPFQSAERKDCIYINSTPDNMNMLVKYFLDEKQLDMGGTYIEFDLMKMEWRHTPDFMWLYTNAPDLIDLTDEICDKIKTKKY